MARLFRFPFAFPPEGFLLAALVALYLVPGLVGHDPWKPEDATHFGVVYSMLANGNWLVPHLAGEPWFGPPLYYWIGGLTGSLFGWLMPLHDAVRLASGACLLFFLIAVSNAAAELHGAAYRRLAILVTLGCLGLLVHGHETQPGLATLASLGGVIWGLALLPRLPGAGRLIAGISLAAAFLSGGLPGLALGLCLPLAAALQTEWRRQGIQKDLLHTLSLGAALALIWPLILSQSHPVHLNQWWQLQSASFFSLGREGSTFGANFGAYLSLLGWYAWPALPLAAWTLWKDRRTLHKPAILLPLLVLGLFLLVQAAHLDARSASALPLLLPLILLATPATDRLRRGAANAFDWFGMMTFSLALAIVWLLWVAMIFGQPPRIAANMARLAPGFPTDFRPLAFIAGALITLIWSWLIFASPRRSPVRGTVHWATGTTALWALCMLLWLPGLDYAKTYRSMVTDLGRHIPAGQGCISGKGLGTSQRASLHYFAGVQTRAVEKGAAPTCRLLLVQAPATAPTEGWKLIWEGHRPSDRDERYQLYSRTTP